MSMVTGCPACGTMFRVVPDQLKISDGWVRCGHCSEVFDASAHMVPPEVLRDAGAPVREPEPEPPAPAAVSDPVAITEDAVPAAADAPPPDHPPAEPAEPSVETPVAQPIVSLAAVEEPVFEAAVAPLAAGDPVWVEPSAASAPPVVRRPSREIDDHEDEDDDDAPPLEDVGFIRKARRRAFWSRPAVRAALLVAALALAALLGAQFAYHERDRLAAAHPDLLPWLARFCQPLGCTIGAPRRIEAIAIDSSTFSKLRSDTYRLSLTLKNQARQPVAIPAIELTLTDTQDQAVLRRVLQPAELGAAADTIASGAEWNASAAVAVSANGTTPRIAGYRLLAFYP